MRLAWLLALLTACSTGTNLFNDAGAGGATTSGTPSVATSGSGGTTTTTTSMASSTTTSAQGGQGPGNTSSSSVGPGGMGPTGSGGSPACAHDVCEQGAPLASNCDACVTQICAQDPYCCNQMWDHICVGYVDNVCQIDCFPIGMGPCGMQYPNHPVCSDDNDQCALAYDATQSSCTATCQTGGGECLGAFNDVQNQMCQVNPNQPVSCSTTQLQSGVCVCSQGCGNGPACPSSQTCIGGNCI